MIAYFFKTVLCSGFLLGVYYFFLSREKMYLFNRIFLLASLITPFLLPLITLPLAEQRDQITFYVIAPISQSLPFDVSRPGSKGAGAFYQFNMFFILLLLYSAISGFLLYRFIKNITLLIQAIKHSKPIVCANARLIPLQDNKMPYSFLRYIFLSKADFEQNSIAPYILTHELTHVREYHSLDVLFTELLLVVAWWNPFLYLFKKFIQLNHEFLADEAVIEQHDVIAYQKLLLQKSIQVSQPVLVSRFNFSITKKRFFMMTKHTSKTVVTLKKCAVIPLIAILVLLFSNKPFAQIIADSNHIKQKVNYGSGALQELLNEYDVTLQNMVSTRTLKNGKKVDAIDMNKGDIDRLAFIYRLMNQQQREERFKKTGITIDSIKAPQKNPPSAAQLQKWTDPKIYGVWIDGKRIANSKLSKYSSSDFALYTPSRLEKNAVKNDKFLYQIDLMTPAYYSQVWEAKTHYVPSVYRTNNR